MQRNKKRHIGLSIFIVLGLTGMLVACYFLFPSFQNFLDEMFQIIISGDEQRITTYFKSFGAWGPILFAIITVLQMFLIVFPIWIPMIVAVLAYGWLTGSLISVGSLLLASIIGYYVGKLLGKRTLNKFFAEEQWQKMQRGVRRYGFITVVLFRMSPLLSSDAIGFIAGAVNMSLWRYIAASVIGYIPVAIIVAYFAQEVEKLKHGIWWLGGLGIAVYVAYVIYDRLMLRHKRRQQIA